MKQRRHDAACDVLADMYQAIGGTAACDHFKTMNPGGSRTVSTACALPSGARVDVILYGAGSRGADVAIDVSFVCIESFLQSGFKLAIERREKEKNDLYKAECASLGLEFYPFVLGSHGGFGRSARAVWALLVRQAEQLQSRDWRHAWTSMSFSACWSQKLSIAVARETAIGAQRRMRVVSRFQLLGGSVGGDQGYVSWAEGRSTAGCGG